MTPDTRSQAYTNSFAEKSVGLTGGQERPPTIPGYEILGVLGRGGMGVVYQARQTALNRLVALKTIRGEPSAAHLARFEAEAQAAARLQHPCITQIFEVGNHAGQPYFTLEFVAGGSLSDALNGTPLPFDLSARLVEQLAQAIQVAHRAGVVHRDLKPGNILLTTELTPKITDFGLAKLRDATAHLTMTGSVMGTPQYMAPEQASGQTREAGPAADIYALGAILYECLTGRPPFRGASLMETLEQVRLQPPVPPSVLRQRVPASLEAICLKALAKNPEERYPSAAALADDLARAQTDGLTGTVQSVELPTTAVPRRSWGWLLPVLVVGLLVTSNAALWVYRNQLAQATAHAAEMRQVRTEELTARQELAARLSQESKQLAAERYHGARARISLAVALGNVPSELLFTEQARLAAPATTDANQYIREQLDTRFDHLLRQNPVLQNRLTIPNLIPESLRFAASGRRIVGLTRTNEPGRVSVYALFVCDGQTLTAPAQLPLDGFADTLPQVQILSTDTLVCVTLPFQGKSRAFVVDVGGATPVRHALHAQAPYADAVAFSADGRWGVIGHEGTVQAWDMRNGKPLRKPFALPGVTQVAIGPGGRFVVFTNAARNAGQIHLGEVATGKVAQVNFQLARGFSAEFNPLETRVLLTSPWMSVMLDTATGATVADAQQFKAEFGNQTPHKRWVRSQVNGRNYLYDRDARLPRWQSRGYAQVEIGHGPTAGLVFQLNEQMGVWLNDQEQRVGRALVSTATDVQAHLAPDGSVLLFGDKDAPRAYTAPYGLPLGWPTEAGAVHLPCLRGDRLLLYNPRYGRLSQWRLAPTWEPALPSEAYISDQDFSLNGERVVCRGITLTVLHLLQGKKVILEDSRDYQTYCRKFSATGKWVATCAATGDNQTVTVRLWDGDTGKVVKSWPNCPSPEFVQPSPDGRVVWLGLKAKPGQANLTPLTVTGPEPISPIRDAQASWVTNMEYSPDGSGIMVVSKGSFDIHDAATGKLRFSLPTSGGSVGEWSDDGKWYALGRGNGTITIYDAVTGKPVRTVRTGSAPAQLVLWEGQANLAWVDRQNVLHTETAGRVSGSFVGPGTKVKWLRSDALGNLLFLGDDYKLWRLPGSRERLEPSFFPDRATALRTPATRAAWLSAITGQRIGRGGEILPLTDAEYGEALATLRTLTQD